MTGSVEELQKRMVPKPVINSAMVSSQQNNQTSFSPYQMPAQPRPTPQSVYLQQTYPGLEQHEHPVKQISELAVISLIFGILGLVIPFFFNILAIVFGIGGLIQSHKGMKGSWLAILGMALGLLGIVLVVVAILYGIDFLQPYLLRLGGIEGLLGKAQGYLGK